MAITNFILYFFCLETKLTTYEHDLMDEFESDSIASYIRATTLESGQSSQEESLEELIERYLFVDLYVDN